MRRALSLGVVLLVLSSPCWSAVCTVGTSGIEFGGYDPFSPTHLEGAGTITVTCDTSTPYSIALSQGSGTFDARVMRDLVHSLFYNLYTDATRTTIWGDGSGDTAEVGATGLSGNHTVYGRIPAGQNAHVGNYSDAIVVTLTF